MREAYRLLNDMRAAVIKGGIQVRGEVGSVGIHTGTGGSGRANIGMPEFCGSMGNPLLLEELLARHPKLRLWIMHARLSDYRRPAHPAAVQLPRLCRCRAPQRAPYFPEKDFRRRLKDAARFPRNEQANFPIARESGGGAGNFPEPRFRSTSGGGRSGKETGHNAVFGHLPGRRRSGCWLLIHTSPFFTTFLSPIVLMSRDSIELGEIDELMFSSMRC